MLFKTQNVATSLNAVLSLLVHFGVMLLTNKQHFNSISYFPVDVDVNVQEKTPKVHYKSISWPDTGFQRVGL